jgi:NADH-quinone oxidoreductase subunit H
MAVLFFGGWRGPWAEGHIWLGLLYFIIKTSIFYLAIIWSRLTFPRVRIDQLMNLNWKFMVPLSIVLMMGIPLIDYATRLNDNWVRVVAHFSFNVVLGLVAFGMAARADRRANKHERVTFEGRPLAVMPEPPVSEEEAAA